ncbi:MAG: hypothetical protein ABIP48_01885, partial [Planctomycetota bacterium]
CRRISVILYRAVAGEAASGKSAAERGPAAGALPSIQARFRVEERPAPGLHPPAIARIKPVVTGAGGRALPSWFREELVTGCRVVEQNEEGFLLRNIEMRDIDAERVADVFEKTTSLRVRFFFSPRSDQTFNQEPEKVTAAASHVIDSIEQGKQYTIKLELTDEGLDWLRLLGKNNQSAATDAAPKPDAARRESPAPSPESPTPNP